MAPRGRRPVTPLEAWQATQTLGTREQELQDKTTLALEQRAISASEVDPQTGTFLGKAASLAMPVLDLLQRGNFALAGFADNILNERGDIGTALGRAGTEFFSGLFGLKGEKETFKHVLDGQGFLNSTELRDVFEGIDSVPLLGGILGSFNVRGGVGLALDIFTDPLTYMSGIGLLSKVPRGAKFAKSVTGKTSRLIPVLEKADRVFTRKGSRIIEEEAADIMARQNGISSFADDISNPLFEEADRIAIEEVQERLMRDLSHQGVAAKEAADLTTELTRGLDKLRKAKGNHLGVWQDTVNETLKAVKSTKTRRALSNVLGTEGSTATKKLAQGLNDVIGEEFAIMGKGDLHPLIKPFAADLARKRAMASVIESGLHMQKRRGIWFNFPGLQPWRPAAVNNLIEGIVKSTITQPTMRALMKRGRDLPGIAWAVDQAVKAKPIYDMMGRAFHRDWNARKLAGYNTMKQAHLDATSLMAGKFNAEVTASPLGQWSKAIRDSKRPLKEKDVIFRQFAQAIEKGDRKLATELGAEGAYDFFTQSSQNMALTEVQRGLLKGSRMRKNYFPHFFKDSDGRVQEVVTMFTGKSRLDDATIGRHAENRSFNSLDDVDKAVLETGKKITPIVDPEDVLARRFQAHSQGILAQDFQRTVLKEFGRLDDFNLLDMYHLTEPVVNAATSPKAFNLASKMAERTRSPKISELHRVRRTHGDDTVREYLRQRMLKISTRGKLQGFLTKHESLIDLMPQGQRSRVGELAADGSEYVAIPGIKTFKQWQLPKSVALDMQAGMQQLKVPEQLNALLDAFDNVNNLFKTTVTRLFPAFHFRNNYGNVFQSFLEIGVSALNPRYHVRAAHLMASIKAPQTMLGKARATAFKKFRQEDVVTTDIGTKISMNQLQEELLEHNVVRSADEIFERVRRKGAAEKIGTLPGFKTWFKYGNEAGDIIENEARIMMYLVKRMKGFSEFEARDAVNKVLFDYASLSSFESVFAKRAIPFYIWTKKNVALQAKALAETPGRVLNATRPFGRQDPDVSESFLDYESEDGVTAMQISRDGRNVQVVKGIDLPIHAIDRVLPFGNDNFARAMWNMVTPLVKTPAEVAFGQSLFTGRTLDRTQNQVLGAALEHEQVPQSIRRWLGWRKLEMPNGKVSYTFNQGRVSMLVKSVVYSRLLSSSNAVFNGMLQDDNKLIALANTIPSFLTSIRIEDRNLDQQALRKVSERIRKVEARLVEAGIGQKFEKFFVPTNEAGGSITITDPRLPANQQPGIGIGRKR